MRALALSLLILLAAALVPAAAHAQVLKDVDDPFFRWDKPLADVPQGTILRKRSINPGVKGLPLPFKADQVLYRTTKQSGAPIAVVATILHPVLESSKKILSYQTAYDDLGSTCVPSYALQGASDAGGTSTLEIGFMLAYVAQGYTIVTSDYEGLTHDYTAGQGAGYATLDGIRAARRFLGVPEATPVGLLGYSGGATATQWASELAPDYAPETNIVAVAEGGTPVHYANIIDYVDGTDDWGGVIPYVLVGLFRGAEIDITKYLSDKGKEALAFVSDKCLDTESYKAARMNDFIAGGQDWKTVRPLVKVINSQVMGSLGTPRAPIFMATGVADGIGDGVMIAADTDALAHQYCEKGVPVVHRKYNGMDHVVAIPPFEAEALAFINARMEGLPVQNDCATISPGRKLTTLPVPPLPQVVLGKVRRAKAGGFTIAVRLDKASAEKVSVTLYAANSRKRKRISTLRPAGELTTAARTFKLPGLRTGVPGRTYEVVVKGTADQEDVTAKTSFKVAARRRAGAR